MKTKGFADTYVTVAIVLLVLIIWSATVCKIPHTIEVVRPTQTFSSTDMFLVAVIIYILRKDILRGLKNLPTRRTS